MNTQGISSEIGHIYEFGPYRLDPGERTLLRGTEVITLPPKALDTLVLMVRNSGRLMEKDELISTLWPDSFVEDGSLSNNIFVLRKALGEDLRYIETVPKRGYRFVGTVRCLPQGEPRLREEEEPELSVASATLAKPALFSLRRAIWAIGSLIVLLAALIWCYESFWSNRGAIHSIAVLPFENATGDPNADYLSDGIAETLIDSLSQLPRLKVMSRDSAFQYRRKESDAHSLGTALGVQAVCKGRVSRQGDMLTISAELIDAHDNSHLWGQQYSRKSSDIFSLQAEIAKEMTSALRVRLTGEEEKRLHKAYTANPEAYESYLKGRYWWNKQTEEGFRKGIGYFEQAIAEDPGYALAHVGLANCYISMAALGLVSAKEGYPKGREWAEKAMRLDDTLAAAHVSLASVKTDYDWDWAGAENEARQAIELNPNDPDGRVVYADLLYTTGRLDESIHETKRALELDPLSINNNMALAFDFFLARRYDEAIAQGTRTLELDPKYITAFYVRGVSFIKKSKYKEAMAEFESAIAFSPNDPVALTGLGYGYAVTGKRADAEKVLARLTELSQHEFVSPVWMAKIYSGLGDKDKAFDALERAYQDRSIVSVAYLKTNPMLDPLRSDPRFTELLRHTNLLH